MSIKFLKSYANVSDLTRIFLTSICPISTTLFRSFDSAESEMMKVLFLTTSTGNLSCQYFTYSALKVV